MFGKAYEVGDCIDTYWEAPKSDFLRLRRNAVTTNDVALTTKLTDKGGVEDRLEINVKMDLKSYTAAYDLLETSHGVPAHEFFQVYTLFAADDSTIISAYKLSGVLPVFIEVESSCIQKVLSWGHKIRHLIDRRIDMSLWELLKTPEYAEQYRDTRGENFVRKKADGE
jgi:hypothetical protein